VILVAIPCVAMTQGRIRLLLRIVMVALTVAMLVALAGGETDREGRLIMSGGEFSNSNTMGMFGVIGLLLCWYSATCPGRRRLTALGSVAAMIPMFQVISRSGSRTALMMLMVLGLYVLYRSNWKEKSLVVGVMVLGVLFSLLTTPETIFKRFSTLFVTSVGALDADSLEIEASAVGSTESRIHHLKMSLLVTVQHPLLGVGPGQFMEAENLLMQQEGRRGSWKVTHNGFTEISSETGLPGLVFYSAALVWMWNAIGKLVDRAARVARFGEVHHTAVMFRILFLVTAVGVSLGISLYHYYIPAFIGLALGFLRSSNASFAAAARPRTQ
jgi:O-antigen ligase